jgi:hypothetical protein
VILNNIAKNRKIKKLFEKIKKCINFAFYYKKTVNI